MDEVRNPFAPGAGSQPPELAGRDAVIAAADVALQRVLQGRHARSQLLLGLRGTGKTVLLNTIERIAGRRGHVTAFVESPENSTLAELLFPLLTKSLRRLSSAENAKAAVHKAMRVLRSFASAFKITMGDYSISVEPEPGVADSGNLELDLTDMVLALGEAAQAAGQGWALFIDELQYLSSPELGAIITAVHRCNQRTLPVVVFGAGLPQLAALSGDAKSYAERLFAFETIGALNRDGAIAAVREPILEEQESIEDAALDLIVERTKGYPYFLQEWGYQCWNEAGASPISVGDVHRASAAALKRLDQGFFRVRFDRLTPKEREYVLAMAKLGHGPYRSGQVADQLDEDVRALGPRRAKIIAKGMIYSPAHGDIDFTVPMFDDFLRRTFPEALHA
jgi:hypothetical protein